MDIPLETIVGYFVAAKSALSSTSHIHRASAIVSEARTILESIAALSARTSFLHAHLDHKFTLLRTLHASLTSVSQTATREFGNLVARLDAADEEISTAVAELRTTNVEPAFRPADEPPRSLESFVDEGAVETLREAIRKCLDAFQDAHSTLETSNTNLADQINAIESDLTSTSPATSQISPSPASSTSSLPESAPTLFRTLESHATELADLLSSLITHYDLCITALKHTEGGAPAAHAALPTSASPEHDPALASLRHAPTPISATERADLLAILSTDAHEVVPVTREIAARSAEMETVLVRLRARADAQIALAGRTKVAVSALDTLRSTLPAAGAAASTFREAWAGIQADAGAHLAELDGLRGFFRAFRRAYDGLLLEVARRAQTRAQMDGIAQRARAEIGDLHAFEEDERARFLAASGEFLPADLWPGFAEPPTRYEIEVVRDGTRDIPVLGEEVVARARRGRA